MTDASPTDVKRVLFVAQDDDSYHGVAGLLTFRRDVRISDKKHFAEQGVVVAGARPYLVTVFRRSHDTLAIKSTYDLLCGISSMGDQIEFPEELPHYVWLTVHGERGGNAPNPRPALLEEYIERVAFRGIGEGSSIRRKGEDFGLIVKKPNGLTEGLSVEIRGTTGSDSSDPPPKELQSLAALMAQLVLHGYDGYLTELESIPSTPLLRPTTPIPHLPPGVSGLLSSISITNIKTLPRLHWQLPEARSGWHVLLGQNASGKTAVLRAIAAVLLPANELGALRQDWRRWVTLGATSASATITLGATDAALGWQIDGETLTKTGHTYDGFSAAYGPFRRFTGGDSEYQREFSAHARLLRHLSLFSERVALSAALDWLKDLEFRLAKGMPEGALADRIKRFINETGLLPGGARLERVDPNGVWFRDANGAEVPADDLSDGYRAVLSLALDLLRHLSLGRTPETLFTELDDQLTVAVEGVVIIDEIDAHLHPTWQQSVGPWFVRRFPRVQFIVATHSAIVCQSADSVLLLPTPGTHDEPRMLTETELLRLRYGDLIDAYGTGVFGEGVTRSPESRVMLARLAALNTLELERPLSDDERAEQLALREILPSTAFVDEIAGDAS